jgi:hypothetical protein
MANYTAVNTLGTTSGAKQNSKPSSFPAIQHFVLLVEIVVTGGEA